jgi:hypothetical protein
VKLWIKILNDGQYVFVEIEDGEKLVEIELQTFINSDESNRIKYMTQIELISSFCSGFNINAINRYYQVLKAVAPYCYNENFPFFSNLECKEVTMKAIARSFDWSREERKLENKYNINYVFDNTPLVDTSVNNRLSLVNKDKNNIKKK